MPEARDAVTEEFPRLSSSGNSTGDPGNSTGIPGNSTGNPRTADGRKIRRLPAPPPVLKGRLVVAAMAAGAFAAAGQTMTSGESANASSDLGPFAQSENAPAAFGPAITEDAPNGMGGSAPPPEVLPVTATAGTDTSAPDSEVRKLAKSERITEERAEARRAKFVRPAEGRFTSGFGGRWGTTHYGIDFANSKGTPIVSAADGEVIEAGPASGFGQWVRVQHDDGTITVYGHVNTITAEEGDSVRAGDQIATMGSRGFSTGTHLHFEVWNPSGKKINPAPWLEQHGIPVD